MRFCGSPWPAADVIHPQYDKFIKGWDTFALQHPDRLITDESGMPKCGEVFANIEPPALRRLILRMMHPVPEKRIRIYEALHDRWVKTIECCARDEGEPVDLTIDVTEKRSCTRSGKAGIRKLHHHLPPVKRTLLHPFEIREG